MIEFISVLIIGVVIGAFIGITIMCLLQINREDDCDE